MNTNQVFGLGRIIVADDPSFPDLTSTMTRLQSLLLTLPTTETFLQRLTALCADLARPTISCGITVRRDGQPLTVASSDERAAGLDETQYEEAEGPCLHTLVSGEVVDMVDLDQDPRWPGYTRRAREAGLRCSLSLPLVVHDSTVGALNVYSFEGPDRLGGALRQRVELFAAQAAGAIQLAVGQQQDRQLQEQLEAALASRSVIDQALGIVMGQQRCTAEEAFALLRARSQNSQTRLRQVAADLVHRVTGQPPAAGRPFDRA